MLLVQMLLPRFLVLEGVLFFHVAVDRGHACTKKVADLARRQVDFVTSCSNGTEEEEARQKPEEEEGAVADSIGVPAPAVVVVTVDKACSVDLETTPAKNLPLFASAAGSMLLPYSLGPEGGSWLALPDGSRALCPGSKLKVGGRQKEASVRSNCDGTFSVDGDDVASFDDIRCSRSIRETVTRTGEECGPAGRDGRLAEVGWKVNATTYWPQMSICHEDAAAETFYVRHVVRGAHVDARNDDAGRPSFKEGRGFYSGVKADSVYKLRSQEHLLKDLLGDAAGSALFSKTKSFLAKGHLAPDADFVYKEWQDATYYFANAAPQWQQFNNGNWKAVEVSVRDYARHAGRDVVVHTGTLGRLEYAADSGDEVALWLYPRKQQVPVPEFYWKILHDPAAGAAVVFVGLNDPHFRGDASVEAQICPDVCDRGLWLSFPRAKAEKGYTYCCEYADFSGAVNWAPELDGGDRNPDLLKNIIAFD